MKTTYMTTAIAAAAILSASNCATAQTDVSSEPLPTYSTDKVDFSLKTPDIGNPGTKITVSPHDFGQQGSATQQSTSAPGVMITIPLGDDGKK